jgi:RND family efflux transporter MFP subunit
MLRKTCFSLIFLTLAASLSGCKKSVVEESKKAPVARNLLVAPEDVFTVGSSNLASGPVITGTIQPERQADLRAEISSVISQVLKENGDPVKRGEVLVRLDTASINDALRSADESVRVALLAVEQTARQVQRQKTLLASGMTSTQALDDADARHNNAQSDLVANRARQTQAREQLQRTEVRAPFDGIVVERKTSAGDTATIGKELLKVVDPTSMRFEGRVSADKIPDVKVGQRVPFNINGYTGKTFAGKVKRIDPAANPVTRQVEVLVAFVDNDIPKVSGLYAEGQVEVASRKTLSIPEAVLVKNGDKTLVWRVDQKVLRKVEIKLGARDPQRGDFEVLDGLKEGDQLIRNPQITFKDGDTLETPAPAPAASNLGNVSAGSASAGSASISKKGE